MLNATVPSTGESECTSVCICVNTFVHCMSVFLSFLIMSLFFACRRGRERSGHRLSVSSDCLEWQSPALEQAA